MNKAKKIFAILMSVFMLTLTYVGCPNVDNGTDNNSTTDGGSGNNNPVVVPPSANNASKIASLQAQIDSTPAGGTVQLSLGRGETLEGLDSTNVLKIDKAITVDASAVTGSDKGIAIEVAHNISSNVSLKGFQSSSLKISSSSLASLNIGRGAIENENGGTFKNFGDGALPLMLDGCSFTEFKAESDVAVFFEGEKSAINELEIMKGEGRKDFEGNAVTEDVKFTFADMVEGRENGDMPYVGKMIVDKGIDDVNLVGGQFGDVEFKDRPADSEMNFRYETKSEDQFADTTFLNKDFIEKRDITVADYDTTSTAGGVYKYTMTKDQFDYLDGAVSIVFLTDEQIAVTDGQAKPSITISESNGANIHTLTGASMGMDGGWGDVILPETPAYTMSLMGNFAADSTADGVHAVHGTESHYMADARMGYVWYYKQVYLDHYQTYSKDAVVVKIGQDEVTYYVNTAAIRKSDLLIGAYPHIDEYGNVQGTGIAGSGSKLSVIDLSQYKPYFVIDNKKLKIAKCIEAYTFAKEYYCTNETLRDQLEDALYGTLYELGCFEDETNIKAAFYFPLDQEAGFFDCGQPEYIIYGMTPDASYPAEQVEDKTVPIAEQRTMVDVYYQQDDGTFPRTPKSVILGTIDPWLDDWYYFAKEDCSDDSYLSVAESMQDCTNNWIAGIDGYRGKLWAKPKEKINIFAVRLANEDVFGNGVYVANTFTIQHESNDPMGDNYGFGYATYGQLVTEQQYTSKRDIVKFFTGNDEHDGSNLGLEFKNAKIYKVYDWGKDPVVESQFSEPVAYNELANLQDGDTIYLVLPYVIMNKVSNNSAVNFGAMTTYGSHNGSVEFVSLYDIPDFEDINWYKDASLSENKKWTKAELEARTDAVVFFEQNVIVYDTTVDTTGTKKSYDEFMTMIDDTPYYIDPNRRDTRITGSEQFRGIGLDLKAYKELTDLGKDNMMLHVHGLGVNYGYGIDYETSSVSSVIDNLITQQHYTIYADAAYTQKLETREQLFALEYQADIYARLEGNYVLSFTVRSDDMPDVTASYANLFDRVSSQGGSKYYLDGEHNTQITADNIDTLITSGQLADNAVIYEVFDPSNDGIVVTVTYEGGTTADMSRTEASALVYEINSSVTVPFNGKALSDMSAELTAQYLFYSDSAKTQPLTSNDIGQFETSTTIYAEKVNAIGVAHRIVSVPDTAIEKYLAAGANFYSDRTTDAAGNYIFDENDKLDTTNDIKTAFTTSGKIYLAEDIITEPGSNQPNGNYNYYVVTVYDLDVTNDQGTTMFAPKFNQDYAGYSYYTDASGDNRIDNPTFTNGDNIIYVAHTYQFNDYRNPSAQGIPFVYMRVGEIKQHLEAGDIAFVAQGDYSNALGYTTLEAIQNHFTTSSESINIWKVYTIYDLDQTDDNGDPIAIKMVKNYLESNYNGKLYQEADLSVKYENVTDVIAALDADPATVVYTILVEPYYNNIHTVMSGADNSVNWTMAMAKTNFDDTSWTCYEGYEDFAGVNEITEWSAVAERIKAGDIVYYISQN